METSRSTKLRESSVTKGDTSTPFSSRYELIRPLKKGGTSQLYLVRDRLCPSSATVIKLIRNDVSQAHFKNGLAVSEFSIASRLAHPNIINIYNVHRKDAAEYLVMEYLEGSSLNDLLSRENLNYQQVIELITPIVNALNYLHDNGVVHCDVKPSNIFVTKNHSAKLIDLANCRQDSKNSNPNIQIKENPFFGFSKRYSSPRIMNDEPATIGDDVYSLAVVLYEMLAGTLPTVKSKDGSVSLNLSQKPQGISIWQWKVLKKALFANPNHRFTSVQRFFNEFCRARKRLYVVTKTVLSSTLVLIAAGFFLQQWNEYNARYLHYQAAQQQLDTITQAGQRIRQLEPTMRYSQLAMLDELDEFSRRVVLNDVYEEVAFPVINRAKESMQAQTGSNEFAQLLDSLLTLNFYYSRSQEIENAITALKAEQNLRQQSILIAANDLLDAQQFDLALAAKVNDLAALHQHQWPQVLPKADLSAYFAVVDAALNAEDWSAAIQLFHFGELISSALPQALLGWPQNAEINEHLKNFSVYLASEQASKGYFPSESADFFFAKRLEEVNRSLSNIWFNKDIKRYSSELLEIKSEYRIPENYELYQQTYNLLLNKIDAKIRHHQRSGQRRSMQDLIKLKNTLS